MRNDISPGITSVKPKLAIIDAKIVPINNVNKPIKVIFKFSSIKSLPHNYQSTKLQTICGILRTNKPFVGTNWLRFLYVFIVTHLACKCLNYGEVMS
ncbi:hypothetical protein HMPREF9104_03237 [Lentilactobacillus kisonensis F0435]|uniref:Uncharacterized protein n=1 Tax=Lentilactobacillus kisonensis F0435 TaxID=797516 RepID=H1LKT3_9LACO|nr:hypothetical protein HMPREF9104_03237 [Lentilactobacillus kisonensis F0435]